MTTETPPTNAELKAEARKNLDRAQEILGRCPNRDDDGTPSTPDLSAPGRAGLFASTGIAVTLLFAAILIACYAGYVIGAMK